MKLILERNNIPFEEKQPIGGVLITPAIDKNYWNYRVKLHEDQAILGFPKFMTIGIGFALEEDWNTNLPYTCEAHEIYQHIKHNKKYDITAQKCITAIQLIQNAVRKDCGIINVNR